MFNSFIATNNSSVTVTRQKKNICKAEHSWSRKNALNSLQIPKSSPARLPTLCIRGCCSRCTAHVWLTCVI